MYVCTRLDQHGQRDFTKSTASICSSAVITSASVVCTGDQSLVAPASPGDQGFYQDLLLLLLLVSSFTPFSNGAQRDKRTSFAKQKLVDGVTVDAEKSRVHAEAVGGDPGAPSAQRSIA